jgi:hypothetical protein
MSLLSLLNASAVPSTSQPIEEYVPQLGNHLKSPMADGHGRMARWR